VAKANEKRVLDLQFPMGGLQKNLAYQRQAPFTTPDCENVRAEDSYLERARGGARPGLEKTFAQQLGGGNPVRLLNTVRYKKLDGTNKVVAVAVANGILSTDEATPGTWVTLSTSLTLATDRLILGDAHLQKFYIADEENPRTSHASDGKRGTTTTTFDAPSVSNWTGHSIDTDDDVLVIEESTNNTKLINGTYKITNVAVGEITITPACNDGTDTATCKWRVQRAPKVYDPSAATLAIWFATAGKGDVPTGCPIVFTWNDRMVLAGGADPHAWYMSAQGDALDHDYAQAESGKTGVGRAISGAVANAGKMAAPITAAFAHNDDCCVFASANSLWILRGNPGMGGYMRRLSSEVGIVDKGAYCYTPEGWLFFLSLDGIWMMDSPCGGQPREVSRWSLPQELLNIDRATVTVTMAYDLRYRGIHLFLSESSGPDTHWWIGNIPAAAQNQDQTVSFWKYTYNSAHEPFSIHARRDKAAADSVVLLGCRDGYVRNHDHTNENDDSTAFNSHVVYGPFRIGDGYHEGKLTELIGEPANSGGDVDWAVRVGTTAEEAFNASARESGEWNTTGLNYTARPRARGMYVTVKLTNGEASKRWAMESMIAVVVLSGRRRK
jgi:hypothetical protein